MLILLVIPAKAGIQTEINSRKQTVFWAPAFSLRLKFILRSHEEGE
jgi:hypothetical protein